MTTKRRHARGPAAEPDLEQVVAELAAARDGHWEDPAWALDVASRAQELARVRGLEGLRARALAVQGTVTLNRGDLRGAFTLAAEADVCAEIDGDPVARLEVVAFKAQLSFFAGGYAEALRYARASIELADGLDDLRLRVFARRAACLVLGNLEETGWTDELDRLVAMSTELGDAWQEALSRNDRGHQLMVEGHPEAADAELGRALALLDGLDGPSDLGRAVVHCTRAELRLRTGRAADALEDAHAATSHLLAAEHPNPYVFGMTVSIEVRALLALGRPGAAQSSGERALERLGDRLPQARSMILESVATALREAGRLEEAFDTLARGAALEREALHELAELQLGFERASLETQAARREADALAAKNRELEVVLGRLAQSNAVLEHLQEQLQEQAVRDPLTGLHNRRHLMSVLDELATEPAAGPLSIAVLDLDHFKAVNDSLGHAAGDLVLVRVAALLASVVRTTDTVARTGGEEFVLLMPDTDHDAAFAVCTRLLEAVRAETWQRLEGDVRVTVSAGVATIPTGAKIPEAPALLHLADTQLYVAKRAGRNCVA